MTDSGTGGAAGARNTDARTSRGAAEGIAENGRAPHPAVLRPAEASDREDATAFVGRVSRWNQQGPVRIRRDTNRPGTVQIWARTPFDPLVTRSVRGAVEPADVTVYAGNLLAGLAIAVAEAVDPGPQVDELWRSELPPVDGWTFLDRVPASVLSELAQKGTDRARQNPDPHGGAPISLLNSEALRVAGAGIEVSLNVRMMFAMSGMGFAPATTGEWVKVLATRTWVRIDARYGSVVRRRSRGLSLLA